MPRAARADSEYLGAAFASRIDASVGADDEHPSASLGHSEPSAVENSPCAHVPDPVQRVDDRGEVAAVIGREKAGDVFEENPSGSKSVDDPVELPEEAGSLSGEAGSSSGDGHVLAGEASGDEINTIG